MLAFFYVSLKWFPPGRLSVSNIFTVTSTTSTFKSYTGLLTIDGLLNGQYDIAVDALRNAILPGLNSSAVSMASLFTGVFVVESVFNFHGISELIVIAMAQLDRPLTLGVTVYSVLIVLPLMFLLDVLQAVVDPRIREGVV